MVIRVGLIALVAIAIAGTWLALEFRRDMREQHARIATGSRLVLSRCGTVEVAEAGSGPALLVVHGAGGGFDQGLATGAHFAARGWRVIAPSRFGYLRTPLPADASNQAQADHLACLLDALGVTEAAVMGVSAGALSATQFAIRHPQRTRALILMVPAGHRPEPTREMSRFDEWLFNTMLGSDFPLWFTLRFAPDTAMRRMLGTPPAEYAAASLEEKRAADRARAEVLPVSMRRPGMLNDIKLSTNTPRYELEAIRAPTLIISAQNDGWDSWAGARYAAEHVRGARFLGFERGGHLLLGHQAEVIEAVTALLRVAE